MIVIRSIAGDEGVGGASSRRPLSAMSDSANPAFDFLDSMSDEPRYLIQNT